MREIAKSQRIGRILQVAGDAPPSPRGLVIQTFGPPLPNSTKCTSRGALRSALQGADGTDVSIVTVSSFQVDDELYRWMRMCNCRGIDLFVFTMERYKVWYSDELIHSHPVPRRRRPE